MNASLDGIARLEAATFSFEVVVVDDGLVASQLATLLGALRESLTLLWSSVRRVMARAQTVLSSP